jgi:predicted membrane protein
MPSQTHAIIDIHANHALMSQSLLLTGLLFSTIGLGFFVYGKRQKAIVPLLCGLALMTYVYFITNILLLLCIGVALAAIPYFFRY